MDSTLDRVRARLAVALAPPSSPLVPFMVDGAVAGRVTADRTARIGAFGDIFRVDGDAIQFVPALSTPQSRTAAMAKVVARLAAEDALTAWRNERYAVAPAFGAPPWFEMERAAARYFGVRTYAAHANGLVRTASGVSMWLARRSATKSIDPGKLDNLVAGGIASGMSIADTLIKEAWEEAGIARDLAASAIPQGEVTVLRENLDGIQHETMFVHDLWLDPTFVPDNQDGEAVEHRLVPLDAVLAVLATSEMTVDATLVALDCVQRLA